MAEAGLGVNPHSLANLRPWTKSDRDVRGTVHVNPKRLSLVKYIRSRTDDGREMADFMLAVLRGERLRLPGLPPARAHARPNIRLRMQAADWLANRAFGFPKESLEVTDGEARQERLTLLASMSDDDLSALRVILLRALEARAQAHDP
jgi:hypothetical protein